VRVWPNSGERLSGGGNRARAEWAAREGPTALEKESMTRGAASRPVWDRVWATPEAFGRQESTV